MSGLFDIMAEEDVGYRQIQILQDAGLIPVETPTADGRPVGVSQNIPQSAIDEMMNLPMDGSTNQEMVPDVNDVIRPRAERQQAHEEVKKEEPPVKTTPVIREINLPQEPEATQTDSFELIFRMPVTGERVNRRFLNTDVIQTLYDFIDHLQIEGKCKFEGGFTDKYQIM